jgi:hypothetical protein
VSTFWHPDPEIAFWQAAAGNPPGLPERSGDRTGPAGAGDGDPEPPAGVLEPPQGAIEVTGFGDPVRSFLPARALTPEEEEEFRRDWENLGCWIAAGVPGPPVIAGMIAPGTVTAAPVTPVRDDDPPFGTHRGQCQGCGLQDRVDIWGRCFYCAELAALRARNLPGPPLACWWYLVPGVLALGGLAILIWAVLYVIFY